MNIDQLEIEIGDNLFLRISDVTLTPGRPGRYSGAPEDCYEDEPPELDWKSQCLVKYSKYRGEKVELTSTIDNNFTAEYYDELLDTALEYAEESHRDKLIEKYEQNLQDRAERMLFGGKK